MNRQTRKVSIWIMVLAVLIFLSWGYYYLHLPTTLPIKVVKVVGKYHFVNRSELQTALMPYVERGFFNVDVKAAEKAIRQLPGVKKATIRRVWPNEVQISINEKKPEARLPGNAFYAKDGTVFKPRYEVSMPKLPLFEGAKSDLPTIKKMYQSLNQTLKPDNLQVSAVAYDGLGSWSFTTNKGFKVILGRSNIQYKLQELTRFYKAFQTAKPGKVLAYIDLRYHQGLAVSYKVHDKKSRKSLILRGEAKESRIDYT